MSIRINVELYKHKPGLYDVATWRFFDQEQSTVYNVKGIYWIAAKEAKDFYSRNHKTNYGILYLLPRENDDYGRPIQREATDDNSKRNRESRNQKTNSNVLEFRRPNKTNNPR